mmetsp:Transcript_64991/g.139188  ORF Transcript_64991/g.139188 Transcript_64991/m.139188 type:complete len:212 (+) Transcript_64991:562-1197(+)
MSPCRPFRRLCRSYCNRHPCHLPFPNCLHGPRGPATHPCRCLFRPKSRLHGLRGPANFPHRPCDPGHPANHCCHPSSLHRDHHLGRIRDHRRGPANLLRLHLCRYSANHLRLHPCRCHGPASLRHDHPGHCCDPAILLHLCRPSRCRRRPCRCSANWNPLYPASCWPCPYPANRCCHHGCPANHCSCPCPFQNCRTCPGPCPCPGPSASAS